MAVAPTYATNVPGGIHIPGDYKELTFTGTVGASDTYVTGGFSIPAATLGVTNIAHVDPVMFSTGHIGFYLPATNLLKVFSAMGTELANTSTALQNATFIVKGIGK